MNLKRALKQILMIYWGHFQQMLLQLPQFNIRIATALNATLNH